MKDSYVDERRRMVEEQIRARGVRDPRVLAAMAKAQDKAKEFVAIAEKDGWKNAVEKFNNLYSKAKADGNTASVKDQTFKISKKNFKAAIGALYKKRFVALEENGIRLLNLK